MGAKDTGVPSWESKQVIEEYMKSLSLPLTVLRPMAFMELMTDKKLFPAVSTWHVMPNTQYVANSLDRKFVFSPNLDKFLGAPQEADMDYI